MLANLPACVTLLLDFRVCIEDADVTVVVSCIDKAGLLSSLRSVIRCRHSLLHLNSTGLFVLVRPRLLAGAKS